MVLEYGMEKYRSGDTGMIVTREQTKMLRDVFSYETRMKMIADGLLIKCGEWPEIVEERSWKELCEDGMCVLAVKKYKEDYDQCSVKEAMKAVDDYCEYLKNKYSAKA